GRLRIAKGRRPELVTLIEKLLVPALAKVANLVPEGGVWMNTQRPEWNDANNALAGNGLSMVTLYQLRDYADWCARFLDSLGSGDAELSETIASWCEQSSGVIAESLGRFAAAGSVADDERWRFVSSLGSIAEAARDSLRERGLGPSSSVPVSDISAFFRLTRDLCDHSVERAKRSDGLYESYRVLRTGDGRARVESLFPMLEGQVSVLASGVLSEKQSIELLEALFDSELYREDQNTFILYPRIDRPPLLDRNRVPPSAVESSPALLADLERGTGVLVTRDDEGIVRFAADLTSIDALRDRLDGLGKDASWSAVLRDDDGRVAAAYEQAFGHARFTGRSGTMHKYEGLGSVYWHMVSKLMLAVQETVLRASDRGAPAEQIETLLGYYRRVRDGLGFRKTPVEFGAVPFEPYSHTPWAMGAQQPGMTGQVKEGVLARFAEVGVRLAGGSIRFDRTLIDDAEWLEAPSNVGNTEVAAGSVGSTLCGVPVVVSRGEADQVEVVDCSGGSRRFSGRELPGESARSIFGRTGEIAEVRVTLA
ncbi:MAG: hypothetical protein AAFS11_10745, partial [Planctomycetota bacterium]